MPNLYTVRKHGSFYVVTKFDELLNVEAVYTLYRVRSGRLHCPCFQYERGGGMCRHREIISIFVKMLKVNKGWFYDYDNCTWEEPIAVQQQRKNLRRLLMKGP